MNANPAPVEDNLHREVDDLLAWTSRDLITYEHAVLSVAVRELQYLIRKLIANPEQLLIEDGNKQVKEKK